MEVWTVDYKLPGDLIPSLWFSNWCPEELLILTVAAELEWNYAHAQQRRGTGFPSSLVLAEWECITEHGLPCA